MDQRERLTQDEFIVLVSRHERRVRGFASSLVYHREDVDEVVQQTFLTAWKKMDEFQRVEATFERDFVRWLCTIARFQSLGYCRKHRGTRLLFDSDLVSKLADLQIQEESLQEDRRRALAECIEKLAPKQKDLVRRYYRATESAAEIAEQDGVTRQAVFKKLRFIREALLACIGQSLQTSEVKG